MASVRALVTGAALIALATAVTPTTPTEPFDYLSAFAAHPGRVELGAVLFVIGHLLLVPGLLLLGRLVPSRAARISAGVAVIGTMLFAGVGFTRFYEAAIADSIGARAGVEVMERFNVMPGFIVLVITGLVGTMLGGIALFTVLVRAGLGAWWMLAALVIGFFCVMIGGDGTAIGVAGSALLLLAFAGMGMSVARSSA